MFNEDNIKNLGAFSEEDIVILRKLLADPAARVKAAQKSFVIFLALYMNHLIKKPVAPFHQQMIALLEDSSKTFIAIEGFRGCAKSTLVTQACILWSILGFQQKKQVLVIGGTMEQTRWHMRNIRAELEENELLREDLGPFQDESNESREWRTMSFYLPKYKARIMGASRESGVRGMKNREDRVDLCILDDVESPESVKTREARDKNYQWFTSDIIPLRTGPDAKYILLGTHVHGDSLIQRMRHEIEDNRRDGSFRSFPLVDEQDNPTWVGMYRDKAAIEELKRTVVNEVAWDTEYLLKTPVGEYQLVRPEWLKVYEESEDPGFKNQWGYRFTVISVDPAATIKENSDYSAIIVMNVYRSGEDMRLYITEAINKRLTMMELKNLIADLVQKCRNANGAPRVVVETVGTQAWLAQELKSMLSSTSIIEWNPTGAKEDRLRHAAGFMHAGQVWFPNIKGEIKRLAEQLTGFGYEAHDDLVDSFSQGTLYATEETRSFFLYPGVYPELPPFPAEREEWQATHRPAQKPPVPLHRKPYLELTAEEFKQLEDEEVLRQAKESEEQRRAGLGY